MKRGDRLTGGARRAHDVPEQMVRQLAQAISGVLVRRDSTDYVIPVVAAGRLAALGKQSGFREEMYDLPAVLFLHDVT